MLFNFAHLKNLSVFTESGLRLGHISEVEIDIDSQSIIRYLVESGRLISRWQLPLLVHRSQVVSISKEKMVVEDAAAKVLAEVKKKKMAVEPAPSGVSVSR